MSESKCPCGKCHCLICGNQMEKSKLAELEVQVEKLVGALNVASKGLPQGTRLEIVTEALTDYEAWKGKL